MFLTALPFWFLLPDDRSKRNEIKTKRADCYIRAVYILWRKTTVTQEKLLDYYYYIPGYNFLGSPLSPGGIKKMKKGNVKRSERKITNNCLREMMPPCCREMMMKESHAFTFCYNIHGGYS